MRTILFILLILIFVKYQVFAQNQCSCCTEAYKQFDFWVGEWIVKDTLGQKVGENLITKIENNCVLTEKWTGVKGSSGSSFNYYDKSDETWNQVWMNSRGGLLKLKGGLIDGKMVLKSKLIKGKKKKKYYNQITWAPNKNKTVSQLWEIYNKKGKLLKTIFLGIYHKK